MNLNDVVNIKNDFLKENLDYNANKISNYLELTEEGIKLKDLETFNIIFLDIIKNFEKDHLKFKTILISFFTKAKLGFVKEKSFDDKLNLSHIIKLIQNIMKLSNKIDLTNIEKDEKAFKIQKSLIEINYHSLDFLYIFIKSKNFMKVEIKVLYEELKNKNKIEYLASKRTKNKRQCEKIQILNTQNSNFNFKLHSNPLQTKNFIIKIFDQSEILIKMIEFIQKHHKSLKDLSTLMLEIINIVCHNKKICQKICSYGFLKDLLYIIYDKRENFKNYIIRISFEILWNSVHLLSKKAISTIQTEDTLFIAKEMLCIVISKGYKMEDKTIRNELLVLINYLLNSKVLLDMTFGDSESELLRDIVKCNFKNTDFDKFYLLEILLYICTIDEVIDFEKKKNVKKFFELGNEDLICKKLVINSVTLVIKNSDSEKLEELIKNSFFIETLFIYFELYNGENLSSNTRYSIPQIKEIQSECLNALEIVASKFNYCFFEKNRLLLFLKYLRNSKDNQKIYSILRVFEKLSNIENVEKRIEIVKKGTIDLLLYYINGCERLKNLEKEDVLKIKKSSFFILANLCKNCPENQFTFSQKGGIDIINLNLKNSLLMKTERNSLYVINIFKCLTKCVFGNKKNEEFFLENEGFYILLEFLESCLKIHYKQVLSAISSILENEESLRYFDDWTSSYNSFNTTQLLIKIYIEEDKKFKVDYKKGIIQNLEKPLNPLIKKKIKLKKKKSKCFKNLKSALKASSENKDLDILFENMSSENFNFESFLIHFIKKKIYSFDLRGQIYGILEKAGFERNEINQEESQRLEIVKNYKELKIGEIWTGIRENLEKANCEPIEEDFHFMMTEIEEMSELLERCKKNQGFIEKVRKNEQEEDLMNFFNLIKNYKK